MTRTNPQPIFQSLKSLTGDVRAAVSQPDGALAARLQDFLRSNTAEANESLGSYDARPIGEIMDVLASEVTTLQKRPKFTMRKRETVPASEMLQASTAEVQKQDELNGETKNVVVELRESQNLVVRSR